jgi:hypothetical protein
MTVGGVNSRIAQRDAACALAWMPGLHLHAVDVEKIVALHPAVIRSCSYFRARARPLPSHGKRVPGVPGHAWIRMAAPCPIVKSRKTSKISFLLAHVDQSRAAQLRSASPQRSSAEALVLKKKRLFKKKEQKPAALHCAAQLRCKDAF